MSNKVVDIARSLPKLDLNYWKNVLRVDTDRIRNILDDPSSSESGAMFKDLTGSEEKMLTFLGDLFELDKEINSIGQIQTELALNYKDDECLIHLLLCREFVKNKSDLAKRRIFTEFLNGKTDVLGDFEETDLFRCILLLSFDLEKLIYYILFDSHEKAAMKQYKLIPDEDEARFQRTNELLNQGLSIEKYLEEVSLNEVLSDYEVKEGLGGSSRSVGFLSELDSDYISLYIQRSHKASNIYEQDTTIFGDETKVVIMMFSKDGKVLNLHSVQKDSLELAGFLMSDAYKARLRYIEDDTVNKVEKTKSVLNLLMADTDSLIDLVYIKCRNFDVTGHPTIEIFKEHTTSLSDTINDLKSRGIDVLNDLSNIVAIKLKYREGINQPQHTIPLELHVEKNGVVLNYFNNKLGRLKKERFRAHMRKNYDIIVIPDAANQRNFKNK